MNRLPQAEWERRAENYIQALRDNPHRSMKEATSSAGIHYQSWMHIDRHVTWFKEAFLKCKEERGASKGGGNLTRYEDKPGNEEKLDLFLKYFSEEHTISKAVERVNQECKTGTTLYANLITTRINASHSEFDAVFYERFKMAEASLVAGAYDGLISNAINPGEKCRYDHGDVRAQELFLKARAGDLFQDRRHLTVEKTTLEHKHLSLNVSISEGAAQLFPDGKTIEIDLGGHHALQQGKEPEALQREEEAITQAEGDL